MALKTFVKVSNISNLSDARYCAGMGVDLLGFCVVEGQEHYIKPKHFQEIRGWVTGPKIVAEVHGLRDAAQLESILEDYKPDYLEMGMAELSAISTYPVPVLLSVRSDERLDALPITPAYLIGDKPIDSTIPVLIRLNSTDDIQTILTNPNISGIVLKGGVELKPGLKNTELINEVLEMLETED